jgi:hypothetical protein
MTDGVNRRVCINAGWYDFFPRWPTDIAPSSCWIAEFTVAAFPPARIMLAVLTSCMASSNGDPNA